MDKTIQFGLLHESEVDAGYLIVSKAVDWLLSKGIRQWTAPLPLKVWQKRQQNNQNFALLYNNELAAVLSILCKPNTHWQAELGPNEYWWISTLAVAARFRGQKTGRLTIAKASAFLRKNKVTELYIDCVYGNGFLPAYYESQGFELISRKEIAFPGDNFDMVLMKKTLL